MLVRRGRARLGLEALVKDSAGQLVATLHGRYVMHRLESAGGAVPTWR